jgi:hypothetical protein
MSLTELIPSIGKLSHRDKLRLIHFLLLAVAEEDGCSLESCGEIDQENALLDQMASIEAVVWSPQTDQAGMQALSDLLVIARKTAND